MRFAGPLAGSSILSALALGALVAACSAPQITTAGGGKGSGSGGKSGSGSGKGGSPGEGEGQGVGGGNGSGFLGLGDAGFPDARTGVMPPAENQKCAEEIQNAKILPLDLLLLMDSSRSMQFQAPGGRTKWDMAREALLAFLKEPKSMGLGVGLQYFPAITYKTCEKDADCGDRSRFGEEGDSCYVHTVCVGPDTKLETAHSCGEAGSPETEDCEAGTMCVPLGRCSMSGGDCLRAGQPCPSGMAGDMCQARGKTCQYDTGLRGSCNLADQKLVVPVAELPGNLASITAAIDIKLPYGATPLQPGVESALAYLRMRQAASPDRRTALVIVTDGLPTACSSGFNTVPRLVGDARRAMPGTPTYVVGVFAEDEEGEARPLLESLATAGGSGMPFLVRPGDDLSVKLTAALAQIRGAALSCELGIPKPTMGQIDFTKVNVRVNAAGMPVDLGYVGQAARCGARGGWYYDAEPPAGNPTRVILCDSSCKGLMADEKGSVEVRFGCQSRIVE
jgi:hypothetical protein